MFFPEKYIKPVLQSVVDASKNGWNAICKTGNSAGSGSLECTSGGGAGASGGGFDGRLYTNPDNSSRLLNPEDVNSGL